MPRRALDPSDLRLGYCDVHGAISSEALSYQVLQYYPCKRASHLEMNTLSGSHFVATTDRVVSFCSVVKVVEEWLLGNLKP